MNQYPLLNFLKNAGLNILWQSGNSTLLGIPEAIKNTISDTYLQSKISNEALYYLQVKTFLETLNLTEDDVNAFMDKNLDNQRLGLEVFKILESTAFEKQAHMLAKNFKLYTTKDISKQDFDKYTYIIIKLDNHLISLINEFSIKYNASPTERILSIPLANMDLISFGFIKKLENGSWFSESQNHTPYDYKIQDEYFLFYNRLFKD